MLDLNIVILKHVWFKQDRFFQDILDEIFPNLGSLCLK